MAHKTPEQSPPPDALSIEDASGNDIRSESHDDDQDPVLATDKQGNSLTLLEEYAKRKTRLSPAEVAFSFFCASASLAFAALIYLNTH